MANPLHILLIDDDPRDRALVIRELSREFADPEVVEVFSPTGLAEALEKDGFSLAVTDYQLGWSNGLEILRTIKGRWPDCPVIMFTGTGSEEIAVEAMKAGLDDYVIKSPKHFLRMPSAIRSVLEKTGQRTALREAERDLLEQLHFIQRLIDTIPNPIFYKDTRGLYLGCNKAFEAVAGLTRRQIIGKSAFDLFPEDLAKKYHEVDQELLDQPGITLQEAPLKYADGTICETIISKATFLNVDGSAGGVVGVFVDISERKRAEEERVRLATAIEQSAESVMITDKDGAIQYVNPAFERVSGYRREEVIGRDPRILKSNRQDQAFYDKMWDTLTRGHVWRGRIVNKKKDGSLYEEEATISPVLDESGHVVNFVAVKRDMTNEIRLERLLRQAQKMEALGTLAGGIAHDFNNILGAIMGYTELALSNTAKESMVRSDLEQVLKASYRARDLVKQILAFSRQSEKELKLVEVGKILKEALKLLRASLPSNIEIRENIQAEGLVLADPTQIHQLLMNFCTNSAHAMRQKGGVLEVALIDIELDKDLTGHHPDLQPGHYVKLTVSDTGHGITPNLWERVFDPYFTTKKVGEGTGLGLAVAHGIVKSHGGTISLYSEPGHGTVFHVYLPGFKPEEHEVSQPEALQALPGGDECILFVDDEKALVDMGQKMLESLGYRVVVRTSSHEALKAFEAQPDRFDLVITDQTMPHMTGIELANELRKIRSDIPVIVCTGFSHVLSELSPEKLKAMGIGEIVMKPFILRDIAEVIRRVLAGTKT